MSDVDVMFDDDATPPAAPSRPADENRIMGVRADDWALGIERKIDALAKAQLEALQGNAENSRALVGEIRAGFAMVVEVLKTQEQHARAIRDLRTDTNANTKRINELDELFVEHRAEIEKLKRAAAARLKRK